MTPDPLLVLLTCIVLISVLIYSLYKIFIKGDI